MEIVDLFSRDVLESVGKKGYNLGILARNDILVPQGFVVTQDFYSHFLKDIYEQVHSSLKLKDPKKSSNNIKDLILNNCIDSVLRTKIDYGLTKFSDETRYAVRSSGNCNLFGKTINEDSSENSLAGQFESYLNVSKSEIYDALRLCWSSLFNERSLRKFKSSENSDYINSGISVVIQELIPADKSFVVMTKDPFETNNLGIEATYGPCEAIVSGSVTGDIYLCNRENGNISDFECGAKDKMAQYQDFRSNNNCSYVEVPKDLRSLQCLDETEVRNIFFWAWELKRFLVNPWTLKE